MLFVPSATADKIAQAKAIGGYGEFDEILFSIRSFSKQRVQFDLDFRVKLPTQDKRNLPDILYYFENDMGFLFTGKSDPHWVLESNSTDESIWSLHTSYSRNWTVYDWDPCFQYPCEAIKFIFYLATNCTNVNNYVIVVQSPATNFEVTRSRQEIDPNDIGNPKVRDAFKPYLTYKIMVALYHSFDYKVLIGMMYIVMALFLVAWFIMLGQRRADEPQFVQTCLGVLVFLPIFLFIFRTALAPPWITLVDLALIILTIVWGVLLVFGLLKKGFIPFLKNIAKQVKTRKV